MKKTTALTAVLFSVSVLSCTSLQENTCQQNEKQNPKPQSYRIELEDAINSLNDFIAQATKNDDAISGKEIENILIIENPHVGSDSLTKAGAGVDENQYLLYVANFKDNQGYAVLSADTRLPVDIYAITEYGNVTEDDIYADDSVGFSPARMVYLAASGHIPAVDTTNKDIVIDNGGEIPDNDPMPDHPDGEWVVTRWSSWQTTESVPEMLKTKWHQDKPFNDKVYPYPAGCTTIAVFQIMTYNQFPDPHIVNGLEMPYADLRDKVSIAPNDNQYANVVAEFVSNFIESVSHSQGYREGKPYTLIYPNQAVKYFESVGYSNVKIYRNPTQFDFDKIYHSLKNDYPVLVSAMASGFYGHTWVIDGFLKQFRTGSEYGADTGKYYGSVNSQYRTLLHCNWGWGGLDDGYYYSGVFKTNEGPVSTTSILQGESDDYYDSFYRIVTYEIN